MNPDGAYGYQCKDVADDYCLALFGSWVDTIRPGDAKFAYYNASPDYFEKVENTPEGVPPRGAIICWNGSMGGGFGHIAVVLRADKNSFDVVEQNGFTKTRPAYEASYSTYQHVIGWLIPKGGDVTPEEQAEIAALRAVGQTAQQIIQLAIDRETRINELVKEVDQSKVDISNLQTEIKELKAKLADQKPITLDDYSLGALLSAAFSKLFKIK